MKQVFGGDSKRIDHALRVLSYAETIQKFEEGNPKIVTAAAILHDIGIKAAEEKYNSSAGKYQEIEGPPIAETILTKLTFDDAEIAHISDIIANHHSDKGPDSVEFKCVWDADWIININDEFAEGKTSQQLKKLINKVFKTSTGKKLALELFVNNNVNQKP